MSRTAPDRAGGTPLEDGPGGGAASTRRAPKQRRANRAYRERYEDNNDDDDSDDDQQSLRSNSLSRTMRAPNTTSELPTAAERVASAAGFRFPMRKAIEEEEQGERSQPSRQASSYWSYSEVHEFPDLLRAYGTDFRAIADAIGTKTPLMVSNWELHYAISRTELTLLHI
jgi:hypothetical protein